MDLEAIWHTHKQFIMKVIGGAIVFLILLSFRSSIANDTTRTARTNASTESALKDKLGQLEGAEGLEKGVDVCVSSWHRVAPNTIPPSAKAGGNYLSSQLIHQEARRNGYAEGIGLLTDGTVGEGSGENVFLVRGGVLHASGSDRRDRVW